MFARFSRLSFTQQLTLPIAMVSLLVLLILGYWESKNSFQLVQDKALEQLREVGQHSSQEITLYFEKPFVQMETLGINLLAQMQTGEQRRSRSIMELGEILRQNKNYFGTWSGFEPNGFDGMDEKFVNAPQHEHTGRFYPWWIRKGDQITYKTILNPETPDLGDWYLLPQKTKENMLIEPYSDVVDGQKVFMTSAVYTVVKDGKFLGVLGVDISLDTVRSVVEKMRPFEDSRVTLVSDTKMVVSSPDKEKEMKPFEADESVLKMIDEYKTAHVQLKDQWVLVAPIQIFNLKQKWSLIIETPVSTILAPAYKALIHQFLFSLGGLVLILLTVYLGARVSSKKIQNLSSDLTSSAGGISESLRQLHANGSELANLSTHAAASVEETAASLEEISSMVKQNTNNAQTAAGLSLESATLAKSGEAEMLKLINIMSEMEASSKRIEEITTIIDDIAFQTNLLALNASVEAARAGEHGKGFAVVAEAVRSLAQRSAVAAKDIGALVLTSVQQIKQGRVTAQENGEFLKKISGSVDKVSTLNTEIAQASVEQATGITSISTSIGEIDQLVQRNAAQAEEIVATAAEIESKSHVMDSTVKALRGDT